MKILLKSSPNGEMLRLKDVADVEFGSSMYDIYSNLNGKPSAAIVLKQSYGSNASQVIKDVKAKLKEIKATSFPKGWITRSAMTYPNSWMPLLKK
jgi:HAE1 family hydrophobic/amphiphilic exporter-1